MQLKISTLILIILSLITLGCKTAHPIVTGDYSGRTPSAVREFRAAWIATVANINWPSKPGLSEQQQKQEAIYLLDLLHNNNFNAAIFQVRPQCDAMYKSELEPWSYYLTGEQGKAPRNFYDPLEFWIKEAHKRGIELHAWLNPYRAHHVSGKKISEYSIVKTKPELVVKLSSGYWWMDPAAKGTQDHSYEVVMDIINRYDIDGIHFDDYFYPYPSYNKNKDFPDDKTWEKYKKSGGKLSRNDWRRDNVSKFIKRLYKGIKKTKPHVKFGISPFGVYRPYQPNSTGMVFDQYEKLYADAKLWLNEGWLDYWTPQLYWNINRIPLSFPVLLGWWNSQNDKNRHIWPGANLAKPKGDKAIDETINKVMITRGMLQKAPGMVCWSIAPLIKSPKLLKALSDGPYNKQALIPPMPWLSKKKPESPTVNLKLLNDSIEISCNYKNANDILRWIVYYKYDDEWNYKIYGNVLKTNKLSRFKINNSYLEKHYADKMPDKKNMFIPISEIAVSVVDRFGNESDLKKLKIDDLSLENAPSVKHILDKYKLQQLDNFANKLNINYENFKEKTFKVRRHKHSDMLPLIKKLQNNDLFNVQNVGKSYENRNIYCISVGKAKKNVLLWSQMHGNEPTATQAIFDILNFLMSKNETFKNERTEILSKLSLHFVPMLNPDGTEIYKRVNAQGIDLNEDAINLATPEAKILKQVRDSLHPVYGFNLHDQNIYYTVGSSPNPATITMLAPAFNKQKDINDNRRKAMKHIVLINRVLQKYIPNQISRYKDNFVPNAFGDNMQKWGTGTILIESGGYKNDIEKQFIRKMNFVAILSALYNMAVNNSENELITEDSYFKIPENKPYALCDLLIKNSKLGNIAIIRHEIDNALYTDFSYYGKISSIGNKNLHGYNEINAQEMKVEKGKVYNKIISSTSQLKSLNSKNLLKKGYIYLKLTSGLLQKGVSKKPFILLHNSNKVSDIRKGEQANFILTENGSVKHVVINGFPYF